MIDIIIITNNAKDKLKHCLESIGKYTKGLEYILTVVDNNSRDGTRKFLKSYKHNRINLIFNKKNLGFSGGANIALRNTTGELIVFLDDDAEATKDWLNKLYQQIKDRPEVGIVGCKIVYPDNNIFTADSQARFIYIAGRSELEKGPKNYIKECDVVGGTCWLMRRELVRDVGYFDERFYPCQYEDTDYCIRTRLAGYKIIYNGKVKIIHHHFFRDGDNINRNKKRFFKKWSRHILHKFPLKDSAPIDISTIRGIEYLRQKRFKQALIEFKKVESINREISEPFYKALALQGLGRFENAIKEFKKVIASNPSSFLAHDCLVKAYRKIGMADKFKRELKLVFKLFPYYKKNVLS